MTLELVPDAPVAPVIHLDFDRQSEVVEHAQLLNEQNHEGMGTNCLLAMRSILGLKLMRRELGEPD